MKYLLLVLIALLLVKLWELLERMYQRSKDSTIFHDRKGQDRYK